MDNNQQRRDLNTSADEMVEGFASISLEGNLKNSSDCDKIGPPGTEASLPLVVAYCVCFVIAAAGNLSVIITLFRSKRHRRSRISLMICHLAVADLIVAFFMIPLEIGWRLTVEWKAGNVACKVFLFLRAFCLYLSSNILVCVALDRCFAVVYPLRVTDARRRGKSMLLGAWIIAAINALPQSVFFQVQVHPKFPGFRQCVTFDSFSNNKTLETAYLWFCLVAMYFVPLLIIIMAYTAIVCEISNRSNRQHNDGDSGDNEVSNNGTVKLRCSALSHIQRARQRTFRLTITIVLGFIWCWTPYVVMASWYIIDRDSAVQVNTNVQDGLFLMAVSNSCLNPLIYSTYSIRSCRFPWTKTRPREAPVGGKTDLQRRSTDAGSGVVDGKHLIERTGKKLKKLNNLKNVASKSVPVLNNHILCTGTISRTSVLTKLTNATRNNVEKRTKHNPIDEADEGHARFDHRTKNMILFDDNGHRPPANHKHHHSSRNLNLSNSQSNSVGNNKYSGGGGGGESGPLTDDEESSSGRTPAINSDSSNKGLELSSNNGNESAMMVSDIVTDKRPFYCISMGDMRQSGPISFLAGRNSFYSDPARQFEGDSKM